MVFLTLQMAFQSLQDMKFVHKKYPVYISQFHLQLIVVLSDCNWTRIHNHLVRKQTLKQFAKLTK